MNKKRFILLVSIVIVLSIAINSLFNTVIEEKDIKYKEAKARIIELEIKNEKLMISNKKLSKEKDINITEIVNKDGSKTKTTKIKSKLNSQKNTTYSEKYNEKSTTYDLSKKEYIDKTKTTTNPKYLDLGIGIDSNLDEFINIQYNINTLIFGSNIAKKKFGIYIGIRL